MELKKLYNYKLFFCVVYTFFIGLPPNLINSPGSIIFLIGMLGIDQYTHTLVGAKYNRKYLFAYVSILLLYMIYELFFPFLIIYLEIIILILVTIRPYVTKNSNSVTHNFHRYNTDAIFLFVAFSIGSPLLFMEFSEVSLKYMLDVEATFGNISYNIISYILFISLCIREIRFAFSNSQKSQHSPLNEYIT